jgi:hypothetical protein
MVMKHRAGSQNKKEPNFGARHEPKQGVKNDKKVKKPTSIKNQKKFSLKININKLRG